MNWKLKLNTLILSACTLLLVACGGGGGGDGGAEGISTTDNPTTTPTNTPTGTGDLEPTNLRILGQYSFTTESGFLNCNDGAIVPVAPIQTTMQVYILGQQRELSTNELKTYVGVRDTRIPPQQLEKYNFVPIQEYTNTNRLSGTQFYRPDETGYGSTVFSKDYGVTTTDGILLLTHYYLQIDFFEGGWRGKYDIDITDASTSGQAQRKCGLDETRPIGANGIGLGVPFTGEKLINATRVAEPVTFEGLPLDIYDTHGIIRRVGFGLPQEYV